MTRDLAENQFLYTHRGPKPYNIIRSNLITLTQEGDSIFYKRQFVKDDGSLTDGISGDVTGEDIARCIHWGCCGWSSGGTTELQRFVERFLDKILKEKQT